MSCKRIAQILACLILSFFQGPWLYYWLYSAGTTATNCSSVVPLFFCSLIEGFLSLSLEFSSPSLCLLSFPRPERERTATGVDAVCTYRSDPMGHKLDRETLYWELSHNTHGVTKLGSFTLEKNSLYINGEHLLMIHKLKMRVLP